MLNQNEFEGYVSNKPSLKLARNENDYLIFSIQIDGGKELEKVIVWGEKAKDFYSKIQCKDRIHISGERKGKPWRYINAKAIERYATSEQVKDFASKLLEILEETSCAA